MSDCRQCTDFDWCLENDVCGMFKPKTMTEADRIRTMADEELATFLFQSRIDKLSEREWLDWLKQESEK